LQNQKIRLKLERRRKFKEKFHSEKTDIS
jgi:hypothetical protein